MRICGGLSTKEEELKAGSEEERCSSVEPAEGHGPSDDVKMQGSDWLSAAEVYSLVVVVVVVCQRFGAVDPGVGNYSSLLRTKLLSYFRPFMASGSHNFSVLCQNLSQRL